jgi:hypothetical protein
VDEVSLLTNVLIQTKVERWTTFAASPKNRRKFLNALYHFTDFDPAVVVELPAQLDTATGIIGELRRRGAAESCSIVSVDPELDGATMPLADAIERVHAFAEGTVVICGTGLAYYEGEAPKNRFILHRR